MMTAREVAIVAAKALDSKKGHDIKLLQIDQVSSLADHFLICTGGSNTQVKTLCDAVEKAMDEVGEPTLRREGHRSGTWVLLDFGSLVVHVFTEDTRKFYDLERLWRDAVQVPLQDIISE
ncbi:MAG: ribosome silencing factor [Eubacteriales bacterium]